MGGFRVQDGNVVSICGVTYKTNYHGTKTQTVETDEESRMIATGAGSWTSARNWGKQKTDAVLP